MTVHNQPHHPQLRWSATPPLRHQCHMLQLRNPRIPLSTKPTNCEFGLPSKVFSPVHPHELLAFSPSFSRSWTTFLLSTRRRRSFHGINFKTVKFPFSKHRISPKLLGHCFPPLSILLTQRIFTKDEHTGGKESASPPSSLCPSLLTSGIFNARHARTCIS